MNDVKQKTLIVTAPYFPPFGGGLERYAFEITKRLSKTYDWRVVVITSGEYKGKDIQEMKEGLTVYRLSYDYKISNTPFSFAWRKKIQEIFKKEKPDILNIHMPVPGIGDVAATLIESEKIVVTYHAGSMAKGTLATDIPIWFYEHIFLQMLFLRAHKIVCSSEYVRNGFVRWYKRKSLTITPAVDTELFIPSKNSTTEKNVLFVAGLNRSQQHKGLRDLMKAVAKVQKIIPEVVLSIVGEGNMKEEYEKYATTLGLTSIRFEGRLEGEALVNVYQKASVVVLPSYAPAESFGMVLIEGMACKKPTIGTNMGGIPEVITEGENGLLVPPTNPDALAEAIERILLDDVFATRLGEKGYEGVIEKFSWNIQAEKYNALFQTLNSPQS